MILRILLISTIAILTGCTQLFFYPDKEHVIDPKEIGLPYQDHYFESQDGTKLHGWFLPAKKTPKGTIIFYHGNAQNISTHLAGVYWLTNYDFNVFIFDYRGYGKSEGIAEIEGIHQDARAATLYGMNSFDGPFFLLGHSLGGSVLAYTFANLDPRPTVKAVIIESSFSAYQTILQEKLAAFFLTWPLQIPLSSFIEDSYSATQHVSAISPTPLVVAHGQEDNTIPSHHSEKIFEAAGEPKELWIVPERGHDSVFRTREERERLVFYLNEKIEENILNF